MRVLRTVTRENSAATKKPLAKTSASTAIRPKAMPVVSIRGLYQIDDCRLQIADCRLRARRGDY